MLDRTSLIKGIADGLPKILSDAFEVVPVASRSMVGTGISIIGDPDVAVYNSDTGQLILVEVVGAGPEHQLPMATLPSIRRIMRDNIASRPNLVLVSTSPVSKDFKEALKKERGRILILDALLVSPGVMRLAPQNHIVQRLAKLIETEDNDSFELDRETDDMPPMQNPKFQIFMGNDDQFYFRLSAANGELILASEGYVAKAGCQNGIESVMDNAPLDKRYERKTSVNGKPFFVLKAANGEPIGRSEMYESEAGRKNGIEAVKRVAPNAPVEDLT